MSKDPVDRAVARRGQRLLDASEPRAAERCARRSVALFERHEGAGAP
jgi:hypothetical protein